MTSLPSEVSDTQRVAQDHLRITASGPRGLVATVLRTKSVYAREILAEGAWPNHTPDQLEQWAAMQPPPVALAAGMDATYLMDYARVIAVQTGSERDRVAAINMLDLVLRDEAYEDVPPAIVELQLSLLVMAGRRDEALALLTDPRVRPDVVLSAKVDLLNPYLFSGQNELEWMQAWNAFIGSETEAPYALPPLEEAEPGALPFDRLTAHAAESVDHRARVTILMSAYKPGPALLVAVNSAMAQTWRNLELLVVDDASGPEYDLILNKAAAIDDRVTVIRKTVNGGTYRARNTALLVATGDFVTVLDSDDYLHPQAIETQVSPLLAKPSLMATRAQGSRVTPTLRLTRPGYRPRITVAASLMFRFPSVPSRIGLFDTTRKGADTEYFRRVQAAFGSKSVRDIRKLFMISRDGETLSAGEFSNGWRHGARHEYKSAYGHWHAQVKKEKVPPLLPLTGSRAFPQPRRWDRPTHPLAGSPRHYDICFGGDWRRFGGPQKSMMEEIAAAREAGLRVAIMHLEALRFMTGSDLPLCAPILELIREGEIDWLQLDDDVDIDILMIRYPPILQYPPTAASTVRASRVLIMANQAPLEPDGSDQRYVVADVSHRTQELFGVKPEWVPQSPHIRSVLQAQDPEVHLVPWDNPGLIDVDEWYVRKPRIMDSPIKVGRYSRDDRIKFGGTLDEVLRGYSFGPEYEVHMMGASSTLSKLAAAESKSLDDLPDNWRLFGHRAVDVKDFLEGLDFFIYLDNAHANEAFGRVILEALVSGVLTIVHPKHRSTFGDAVDYAYPGKAQALVERYVANPEAYAERVERSLQLARLRYGRSGFAQRLLKITDSPRTDVLTQDVFESLRQPVRLTTVPDSCLPRTLALTLGSETQDWQETKIPMRTQADSFGANSLTIIHRSGTEPEVQDWLSAVLPFSLDDSFLSRLTSTAPVHVLATLTCRDGLAHLASRAQVEPEASDPKLLALSGSHQGLPGWSERSWWVLGPAHDWSLS